MLWSSSYENEIDHHDLSELDIDWQKFRLDVTNYYMIYGEYKGGFCDYRTYDNTLPIEQQVYFRKPTLITDYTYAGDWVDSLNSDNNFGARIVQDEEITQWTTPVLNDFPYIAKVMDKIQEFTGIQFTRVATLRMKPQFCYLYHKDFNEYKYHLPIVNNENVYYMIDHKVYTMKYHNRLYNFPASDYHSVFNASSKHRLNLLSNYNGGRYKYDTKEKLTTLIEDIQDMCQEEINTADPADKILNKAYFEKIKRFSIEGPIEHAYATPDIIKVMK